MNRAAWLGATACAVAMAVACGEDEQTGAGASGGGPSTGATGGGAGSGASGGTTGGTGGATGGTGGATGGTGGVGASGGSAGGGGAAGADSGSVPHGRLLVAGTDFFSQTEIATVNLETGKLAGSVTVSDGDAVPAASGGKALVLERTASKVDVLSASGSIETSIDVGKAAIGASGSGSTNPVSVVLLQGTGAEAGADKGYVFLGNENRVAVISVSTAAVTKTIDFSTYLGAGDGDGAVDMTSAVLSGSKAYFVLGRIDRTTVAAPSYQLACPPVKALLMAIDTATDALVDLNGSSAGVGIELGLVNPVDAALDEAQGRLLVLSAGCFAATDGGATRVSHGIEAVDLALGTVNSVYTPSNQDYLARSDALRGLPERPGRQLRRQLRRALVPVGDELIELRRRVVKCPGGAVASRTRGTSSAWTSARRRRAQACPWCATTSQRPDGAATSSPHPGRELHVGGRQRLRTVSCDRYPSRISATSLQSHATARGSASASAPSSSKPSAPSGALLGAAQETRERPA